VYVINSSRDGSAVDTRIYHLQYNTAVAFKELSNADGCPSQIDASSVVPLFQGMIESKRFLIS